MIKKPTRASNQIKRVLILIVLLVTSLCVVVFSYFAVFPPLERAFCYQSVSNQIGVEPTYEGMVRYVQNSLTPGMTRQEVQHTLEVLGSVDVQASEEIEIVNSVVDQIWVNICRHPFNNISMGISYDIDGRLIRFKILSDS